MRHTVDRQTRVLLGGREDDRLCFLNFLAIIKQALPQLYSGIPIVARQRCYIFTDLQLHSLALVLSILPFTVFLLSVPN